MNELQLFNFKGSNIRTVLVNNEPYFVGKDVADILGYKNGSRDINSHVDGSDKQKYQIGTLGPSISHEEDKLTPSFNGSGQTRSMTIINESGLYSLIMSSKLPTAKEFKHWVTSEVLPSIRKHGAYMTSDMLEEVLTNPDMLIRLAQQLKAEKEGRLIAEQQVNELKPKATYYDQVLASKSLVTITQIAKDYGMSGAGMNTKLHAMKVIYRQGSTWLLYAKYQKLGWTSSETIVVRKADGTKKAVMHTKWTQKGRLGLYELLKKRNVLPLIERDDVA